MTSTKKNPTARTEEVPKIFQFIERAEASPGATIFVERFDGAQYGYVGALEQSDFSVERVQANWGGGRYQFTLKDSATARIITRCLYSIAGSAKVPSPTGAAPTVTSAPAGSSELVQVVMEGQIIAIPAAMLPLYRMIELQARRAAAPATPAPPPVDPLAAAAQLVAMARNMLPPPPPAPQPLDQAINALSTIDSLVSKKAAAAGGGGTEGVPQLDTAAGWALALKDVNWREFAEAGRIIIGSIAQVVRRAPVPPVTPATQPINAEHHVATQPGSQRVHTAREGADDTAAAARAGRSPGGAPDSSSQTDARAASPGDGGTPPPSSPGGGGGTGDPGGAKSESKQAAAQVCQLVLACAMSKEPTPESLADVLLDILDMTQADTALFTAPQFADDLIEAMPLLAGYRDFIEAVQRDIAGRDEPGGAPGSDDDDDQETPA